MYYEIVLVHIEHQFFSVIKFVQSTSMNILGGGGGSKCEISGSIILVSNFCVNNVKSC